MAKNSITDYSKTAASNTDIQSVDIAEGCLPSGINNAIREIMADLADMNDGTVSLTSPSFAAATITGDLTVDTNTLHVDSTNNRVGIGTTSPVSPLEIATTNKLGSTFTGTTNGEGLTVTQTNYTDGNYVSLVEAAFDDSGDVSPNVRIGARFDGGGSKLAFGTSNSYGSGITNTAMFIDSSGNVGIGTSSGFGGKLDIAIGTDARGYFTSNISEVGTGNFALQVTNSAGSALKPLGFRAEDIRFATGSSERMRIDSSGNVGIGTSSPQAEIHTHRTGSSESAIRFTNGITGSTSSDGFRVGLDINEDGVIWMHENEPILFGTNNSERMRISSTGDLTVTGDANAGYISVIQAYTGTTSSATNMHILSNGVFLRTTSSGRYKTGVEDAEMSYAEELYNLRPVYYKSLGTFDNPDHSHWGFIAEEVAEIDPRLCFFKTTEPELDDDGNIQYDDDGNIVETTLDEPVVEGVQYDRIIPLLLMLLKAEKDKVETLETKVADFETRIATLEGN